MSEIVAPDSCSAGDTIHVCVEPPPSPAGSVVTANIDTAEGQIPVTGELNADGCVDILVPENALGCVLQHPLCEDTAVTVEA
jgi:hypothetical protein